MSTVRLIPLHRNPVTPPSVEDAQTVVAARHYLRKRVDARCSVEGYRIALGPGGVPAGYLLVGRPQATRCNGWYGDVADVEAGRCPLTRWQVLNLARVWIDPEFQRGGRHHERSGAEKGSALLPGFTDRRGRFRSTLASEALRQLAARVGLDYLLRRPPVFPTEPYEIRDLISYCDTRLHRGVIYAAAGWERVRTGGGDTGTIETWRTALPPLTPEQHAAVLEASRTNARSIGYRARRAQLSLSI